MTEADLLLAEDMGRFFYDPMGWVMYAFPWDTDKEIQKAELKEPWASRYGCKWGPDEWACQSLDELGEHIREQDFDGTRPADPYMEAIASGHGIGKSARAAWLVLYIMSTRPHSRGVVTANTGSQLRTKTWSELAKWKNRCITGHWFTLNSGMGNLSLTHKLHPETWRVDGLTATKENSEAFAGLHAADSSPWYLFDEASAIHDKIWEVAENGLTDGEPFWFVNGNPTRNTGRFRECFRKFRKRWNAKHVDSRTVQVTNKDDIQRKIEDNGEDSDYVKVRIRGQFPSQSYKQFIPTDLVDASRKRHYREEQYNFAPVILTCDPAWEGDDELVISKRQGLVFQVLSVIPKNDNDIHVANLLAQFEDEHKADAVFVDGGFGTGIVSAGRTMGRTWTLVWFGEAASNKGYANKRAEMWGAAKEWLRQGGAIPDDDVLAEELIGPETVPRMDGKIQLESKKDMKARGLPSPNKADSLVLSFAHPVHKQEHRGAAVSEDWDPYA